MPFYDISHSYAFTPAQREALAERITTLHCTMFNTPSMFVNIRFAPIKDEEYWYGRKRKPNTNRIFGHVRSGSNRSAEAFAKLAEEIEAIWDDVVGKTESDVGPGNPKTLQTVFIVPGITTREESLAIPPAGTEKAWLRDNLESFKERAGRGDQDFKDLLAELEARPELMT
ncbi:hypothetical protein BGZ61DRAFT_358891 [Ilyonectria robusta]|uniref:uncharacterized protein n=1 Tax=Ilyonectria robusta TaxID=1079257 RepID=UPI001E8DBB0C|nr:uncharacterized protein BGZ61DRAFT_358891 [Ilyonectria robusta]KAH8680157.1 hypothetical protein BGZ61DRAFT_358891 [Ilyonectria robusta]